MRPGVATPENWFLHIVPHLSTVCVHYPLILSFDSGYVSRISYPCHITKSSRT